LTSKILIFIKAGKSKFDDWSLSSIKRLMGVPASHIGKPSKLPQLETQVKVDLPGKNHLYLWRFD
jgi:hypothetical protein